VIGRRTKSKQDDRLAEELARRCNELEERVRSLNETLKARSGRMYDLERQYASEHFELQESMRNLKIERMRNAGAFADREIILDRARLLQARIAELKVRLQKHEQVEDLLFDTEPIVTTPS